MEQLQNRITGDSKLNVSDRFRILFGKKLKNKNKHRFRYLEDGLTKVYLDE